jgi:hypothetical protein
MTSRKRKIEDVEEIEKNEDLEESIIKIQKRTFNIEELLKLNATWKLDNSVEDLVFENLKIEESENYKSYVEMFGIFYENKRRVYKEIKRLVKEDGSLESSQWYENYFGGPKKGNDHRIRRIEKRKRYKYNSI